MTAGIQGRASSEQAGRVTDRSGDRSWETTGLKGRQHWEAEGELQLHPGLTRLDMHMHICVFESSQL